MAELQSSSIDQVEKTKTLIYALNLISRNLPLPPHVFETVSSIYRSNDDDDDDDDEAEEVDRAVHYDSSEVESPKVGDLISEFEDALLDQRPNCMSGMSLGTSRESRLESHVQHRLNELEELPSSRGEDLQMKCLLELYGLKLAELQSKVRADVSSEYWLQEKCAYPDKQLFDWGMMRLRRPFVLYGMGDAFAMETDDRQRKKRDTERLSRLEEEEKNRIETRKRKFFAEILNLAREFQLQGQAIVKRRKVRNDNIQA